MGRRGPAPKPTQLKQLAGNPGRRPLNKREAKPAQVKPRCPSYLSDEARREWRRLAGYLFDAGLLTAIDQDALAMYAETVALWVRATEEYNRTGLIGKTQAGNLIQNPYLSIANKAKRDALNLMREFGLTPAARARVVVQDGGKQETENLADMLFSLANEAISEKDD